MRVIFSRSCEYAIRAVLYLAVQPRDKPILIKEISDKLDIPVHFLAKILQNLSREGILVSHKGPRGGFAIAKPANKISLMQVVSAIDGSALATRCVLGFPECSAQNPCPLHHRWGKIRAEIHEMLTKESIMQVAKGAVQKTRRRRKSARNR